MASPAVTYTFSNSTTADAGQVNTNFSDLISGMTDGTKDFSISALTLAGNLTANGNSQFGNATSDTVTYTARIASTFVPSTTATYDQGTSSLGWASLYLGRNSQTVRIIPSASTAATYTFTLPVNVGTAGYALVDSDAAGTTAWQNLAGPSSFINGSLSASVATSALTVALKDAGGSDASSTSPIRIAFRSATAATGTSTIRSVTGALSVVVSSGSTLGHTSNVQAPIYVYALDNAGTVELAVSSSLYDDNSIQSTTAEGGAGAADSLTAIYSTTARSNVAIRLLGRLKSTQATAGTWATTPSEVAPSESQRGPASSILYGLVRGGEVPGLNSGATIAAGYIGETSTNTFSQSTSTSGTTLTSFSLTAGVWLVYVFVDSGSIGSSIACQLSVSATNNSIDTTTAGLTYSSIGTDYTGGTTNWRGMFMRYLNISSTTTYYVVGKMSNASATLAGAARAVRIA